MLLFVFSLLSVKLVHTTFTPSLSLSRSRCRTFSSSFLPCSVPLHLSHFNILSSIALQRKTQSNNRNSIWITIFFDIISSRFRNHCVVFSDCYLEIWSFTNYSTNPKANFKRRSGLCDKLVYLLACGGYFCDFSVGKRTWTREKQKNKNKIS